MKSFPTVSLWTVSLVLAGTAIAQQTAPPQEPPAGPQSLTPAPPPLPERAPDVRMPGETGFSVGLSGWFPAQQPYIDKGRGATFTNPSLTQLQGKPKYVDGAQIAIAIGLHNALRLSYFDARASGSFTTAQDTTLWSQTYSSGTYVSTNYRLQNVKLSFDYLTWPYPVESRRFRLKTLWQVQYTSVRSGFDAPLLPSTDANGNILTDSSGNPISYAGTGNRWLVSPMLGIGVAEYASRNVRLEANVSGFAIPHHSTIWDADTSVNFRAGHFEVGAGFKAFHFKTTPGAEFFLHGTLTGAFVGLRWFSE
jgi:hypothetical protein